MPESNEELDRILKTEAGKSASAPKTKKRRKMPHPVRSAINKSYMSIDSKLGELSEAKKAVESGFADGLTDKEKEAKLRESLGKDWYSKRRKAYAQIALAWVLVILIIVVIVLLVAALNGLTSNEMPPMQNAPDWSDLSKL